MAKKPKVKINDNDLLLRIVFARDCLETGEFTSDIFIASKSKSGDFFELSFYLEKLTTPEQAIIDFTDEYMKNQPGKEVPEISGIVAISAESCREQGIEPFLDGIPVDSHVTVKWNKLQNRERKPRRVAWFREAKKLGWFYYIDYNY